MICCEKISFDTVEDQPIEQDLCEDILQNITNMSCIYHMKNNDIIKKEDLLLEDESTNTTIEESEKEKDKDKDKKEEKDEKEEDNEENEEEKEEKKKKKKEEKKKKKKKAKIHKDKANQNDVDLLGLNDIINFSAPTDTNNNQ